MKSFVVTGGAGFIGSHLVDALLAAGARVRVVDDLSTGRRANLDPRAELIVGDAADATLVGAALAGTNGCFHLAAVASVQRGNEDWLGTHCSNQTATITVLDAARAAGGIPVVYASSAAIYGDVVATAQGSGIAETTQARPLSAYGADKFGSELHASVGSGVHGVPTLGFRFFNVFGPRQDPASPYSGVISIFAARVLQGQTITINGDGEQTRDFVYVGDVVRHLLAGMDRLERQAGALVLNVCTGRATSILRLVETIGQVAGRRPAIAFGPARPGDIRASFGDPTAATAALGVPAQTSLADGLAATLACLAG